MVDVISGNENLVVNKGEGVPSPPPSSSEVSSVNESTSPVTETGAPASGNAKAVQGDASVELTSQAAGVLDKEGDAQDEGMQKELHDTIDRMNKKLNNLDREIMLKVDQRIGKNYVSVIDKGSKEIIREFPPEEIRTFIARFMEFNEKLASETDLRSLIINLEV